MIGRYERLIGEDDQHGIGNVAHGTDSAGERAAKSGFEFVVDDVETGERTTRGGDGAAVLAGDEYAALPTNNFRFAHRTADHRHAIDLVQLLAAAEA